MASIAAAAVTAVCLAVIPDRPAATADLAHQAAPPDVATSPAPQPTRTPPVAAAPVVPRYTPGNFVDADPKPAGYELRAWAYMDRQTGFINGSSNSASAHNSTESMIKAWIASDYLRRLGSAKPAPERLRQITGMIRDSNDQDAQAVWAVRVRAEIKHGVKRQGQIHNAEVGGEMPAVFRDGIKDARADLAGQGRQLLQRQLFDVRGTVDSLQQGHCARPPIRLVSYHALDKHKSWRLLKLQTVPQRRAS